MPIKDVRPKVLLVEDDHYLGSMIKEHLENSGFDVIWLKDGSDALDVGYSGNFDIFVFDVRLPKESGFSVLKTLRESKKTTPAIFITSLSSIDDVEVGFDCGCDDYLRKPFELKELTLRIKKLISRSYPKIINKSVEVAPNIHFNPIEGVLRRDSKEIKLPEKELRLLKALLKKRGQYLGIDEISSEIWGDTDKEYSFLSIRTYIKNLRKILGKERIQNQKGGFYKLC